MASRHPRVPRHLASARVDPSVALPVLLVIVVACVVASTFGDVLLRVFRDISNCVSSPMSCVVR